MRQTRLGVVAAVLAVAGALAPCPSWHGQATPLGRHDNGGTTVAEALRPMPSTHGQATPLAEALRPMPWDSGAIHGM